MSGATKTIKDLIYSSANVYAEFVLGLLVSIVIARSLGPEEYGIYTFIVWLASLAIMIVNAGVGIGAIKFFAELTGRKQPDQIRPLHSYFSRFQVTKALILCALIALSLVFVPTLVLEEKYSYLLWFLVPVVLFKSFHMYQIGVVKGLQSFRHLALIALIVAPINLIVVLLAVFWFPTITGFLTAFLVTSIAYWIMSSVSRRQAIDEHISLADSAPVLDGELKRRTNQHLRTVSVLAVFIFITYGQSELFFLKQFATSSDIAFFSIGFMLMQAATALVPGVYNTVLFSRISHSVADPEASEGQSVLSGTRHMFILTAMVGVPLAIYSDDVIELFYGNEFAEAADVLRVFALMAIVSCIKHSTNAYLMSADKQMSILRIMSVAVVVSLTLDYFLISNYGLWGAIIAYAIVDMSTTLVISTFSFRLLNVRPDFWKVGKIVVVCAIAAGATMVFDSVVSFRFSFLLGGCLFVAVMAPLLLLFDCLEDVDYDFLIEIFSGSSNLFARAGLTLVSGRGSNLTQGCESDD